MKANSIVMLLIVMMAVFAMHSHATPTGPDSIVVVSNTSQNASLGSLMNTSGGTIFTININATTQNYKWKGYVGEISGTFSLQDSSGRSLVDWPISTITGEIYATRKSTSIDWGQLSCAGSVFIDAEEEDLNMTEGMSDRINSTFNSTSHGAFYVATTSIAADTCPSVALNVNGTRQSTDFVEVLLQDDSSLIYASLLENRTYGYDGELYDFQIIVADSALEGDAPNTEYYFYVELI